MTTPSTRSPDERLADRDAILEALDKAVREALALHKRAGNPVAVWRNNRVEWIQPEDIPDDGIPERRPESAR